MDVRLPLSSLLLLALGTWIMYVSDRILDGLRGNGQGGDGLRERHFFYARQRRYFVIAGIPVVLLLIWLVATHMLSTAREADALVFALAMLYFGLVHVCGPEIERWLPKELAVGVLFAAATAVPAWARLAGHRSSLIPIAALFAVLCWLNCTAIEKWEWPRIAAVQAHASTRWAQLHLPAISLCVALAAAVAGAQSIFFGSSFFGSPVSGSSVVMSTLDFACALSAGLFLVLDRSRLSAFHLRIAADVALLTPLLCIAGLR